ncbi:MAG: hypothetical protein WB992_05775 [Bryobacteraceae bacterium]
MLSKSIFWLWLAGLVVLIIGLFVRRKNLAVSRGLDVLIVLGPVFFAAPLALFGAEHLVSARFIMQLVPAWVPFHLFWAYFFGFALLSAAVSLVMNRYVHLSATLLGIMFLLFVALIHVPNVITHPRHRILWAVALRDLAFAGGAFALAGARLIPVSRLCIAIPVLFFAFEHFLHPTFAPGVPLSKVTPAWVPFRPLWGYLTGAILLLAGAALLIDKRPRTAAASIGLLMTLLTVFLYVPILALAPPSGLTEALNYVADTLLFGGAALLLAGCFECF